MSEASSLRSAIINLIKSEIVDGNAKKYFGTGLRNLHCFQQFEMNLEEEDQRQEFRKLYYKNFKWELKKILKENKGELRIPIQSNEFLETQLTPIIFMKVCCNMNSKYLTHFLKCFGELSVSQEGYIDFNGEGWLESLPDFSEGNVEGTRLVFFRIINALEVLPIKHQVEFLVNCCQLINPFGFHDGLSQTIIDLKTEGFGELNLLITTLLKFFDVDKLKQTLKFLTNHFDEETASLDSDSSDE